MGQAPEITYVDMPDAIRDRYQYFTEARMDRLRQAGYSAPFNSVEDGVGGYVAWVETQGYLRIEGGVVDQGVVVAGHDPGLHRLVEARGEGRGRGVELAAEQAQVVHDVAGAEDQHAFVAQLGQGLAHLIVPAGREPHVHRQLDDRDVG